MRLMPATSDVPFGISAINWAFLCVLHLCYGIPLNNEFVRTLVRNDIQKLAMYTIFYFVSSSLNANSTLCFVIGEVGPIWYLCHLANSAVLFQGIGHIISNEKSTLVTVDSADEAITHATYFPSLLAQWTTHAFEKA